MKSLSVIVFVLAFFFGYSGFASAQHFSHQNIEITDPIKDVIIRDSDNDGVQELIFQQGRNLLVYNLRPESSKFFRNMSYILPDDACMYDINPSLLPFVKAGIEEIQYNLAYVGSTGVFLMPLDLKKVDEEKTPVTPTRFIEIPTIFKDRTVDAPLSQNLIFEQGDNNELIVVPGNNKFVLVNCVDKFPLTETISMTMPSFIAPNNNIFESLIAKSSLPAFVFDNLNNDIHKDFIFIDNKISACIYENGKYGRLKSVLSLPTDVFDPNRNIDFGYILTPLISDINNDGCVDVLCTNDSEGIIYIYLNRAKNQPIKNSPSPVPFFPATPNQVIRTGKWIIEHNLVDLNGDSLNDLVLIQMSKLGIMGGLQAILAQNLEWEITVYLAKSPAENSNLVYSKTPNYSRRIKLPFTFSYASPLSLAGGRTLPKVRSPYIWSIKGDYNGDKIRDLLISGAKNGTMEIYFGDKSHIFSKSPSVVLNLRSAKNNYRLIGMPHGAPIVTDINNDEKSDIIISFVRENTDKSISNAFDIFLSY